MMQAFVSRGSAADGFGERSIQAAQALRQLSQALFGSPQRRFSQILETARADPRFEILDAQLDQIQQQGGLDLVALLKGSTGFVAVARGLPADGQPERPLDLDRADDIAARRQRLLTLGDGLATVAATLVQQGDDLVAVTGVGLDATSPDGSLSELLVAAIQAIHDGSLFQLQEIQRLDAAWNAAIGTLQQKLMVEFVDVVRLRATSVADYETRKVWYFSVDLGTGYAWETEDFFTYFGTNIYFRPVNKKAPLSWSDFGVDFWNEFRKRFALTIGTVQSGFDQEDGRFQPVFSGNAAVVGAGLRLNDSLRFTLGGLVFKNEDPNPTISTTSLAWTPFVALSIDWNAKETADQMFKNVFGRDRKPKG